MKQYYIYKKYDDARLRKVKVFFEKNGLSYIEKDTLSEDSSREEADRWQDLSRDLFPIVRIGYKLRVLLFNPSEAVLRKVLLFDDNAAGLKGAVKMYLAHWCPDCTNAVALMNEFGVKHKEIDIDIEKKAIHDVVRWSLGRKVVPTIIIGDELAMFYPDEETMIAVFS